MSLLYRKVYVVTLPNCELTPGACPGFLKGGGPISLVSLKKRHQILKGGSNGLMGGGSSTLVSLGRQILHN